MNGILMTKSNIDLTVEGKKTQTRRLTGLKEINKEPDAWHCRERIGEKFYFEIPKTTTCHLLIKPRYPAGEVVYIKEAYKITDVDTEENGYYPTQVEYRDGEKAWVHRPLGISKVVPDKWFSLMFMPVWAARYFVKILEVRAERLLGITPEDCIAEGVSSREAYFAEWDVINPLYPSTLNSWNFAYSYELCSREGLRPLPFVREGG